MTGAPALLARGASWYGPCRERIPLFKAYAHETGAVRAIGVNVPDPVASAATPTTDLCIGYPSFLETDDRAQNALACLPGLPPTLLRRRDGSGGDRIATPTMRSDRLRAAVNWLP
ncbi:TlpA family protein disulfide reductase [Rhodococcus ruber]|uniref:TlpA family protein disulfide reductase n=1 Tax=Rhodococcus ruber TaxID=1830 RepID=UPI000E6AF45F|nr:hypothetical protein [Rhodococcus ruber]RQM33078.1 hypothetical protein TN91_16970 [Rhodococcus ruber]